MKLTPRKKGVPLQDQVGEGKVVTWERKGTQLVSMDLGDFLDLRSKPRNKILPCGHKLCWLAEDDDKIEGFVCDQCFPKITETK